MRLCRACVGSRTATVALQTHRGKALPPGIILTALAFTRRAVSPFQRRNTVGLPTISRKWLFCM